MSVEPGPKSPRTTFSTITPQKNATPCTSPTSQKSKSKCNGNLNLTDVSFELFKFAFFYEIANLLNRWTDWSTNCAPNWPTNRPTNWLNDRQLTMYVLFFKSIDPPFNQPIDQFGSLLTNWPTSWLINQPINLSIGRLIDRLTNQLTAWPINQPIGRRLANQPANQPSNWLTNQPIY